MWTFLASLSKYIFFVCYCFKSSVFYVPLALQQRAGPAACRAPRGNRCRAPRRTARAPVECADSGCLSPRRSAGKLYIRFKTCRIFILHSLPDPLVFFGCEFSDFVYPSSTAATSRPCPLSRLPLRPLSRPPSRRRASTGGVRQRRVHFPTLLT